MTSQTEQAGALARRIEEQLNQVLVGQPAITRQVLIALITVLYLVAPTAQQLVALSVRFRIGAGGRP